MGELQMQGTIWWKNENKEERLDAKIAPIGNYLIKTRKKRQCDWRNAKSCYTKGDPYHERNINDFTKCYYAANDNENGQREHTQQGYHWLIFLSWFI